MTYSPSIFLAIPVLNESVNLPNLIECLRKQEVQNFEAVFCVNQYEDWWEDPDFVDQCIDNQKSIDYLKTIKDFPIIILDKSSKGKAWPKKKGGVGWARKVAMDNIAEKAGKNDLLVCMDADTYYPPNYLAKIEESFRLKPQLIGLSIPYYHPLKEDHTKRLILRYEIYMRYYLLNMFRINNPYAFTALGSAMAAPVWAYKKIGGLTPVKSGEDFYFLQKLIKNGELGIWSEAIAFPSARFSDRVLFGTGPALLKGSHDDWGSYPIYKEELFQDVKGTFELFPKLYEEHLPTPLDGFLNPLFKEENIWLPLRLNYKDLRNFVRACESKVDGLRILQYLKQRQKEENRSDEELLRNYIMKHYSDILTIDLKKILEEFSFDHSDINSISLLRDFLFEEEMQERLFRSR